MLAFDARHLEFRPVAALLHYFVDPGRLNDLAWLMLVCHFCLSF
jgi:hypothetical protein